ncbi:MAG: FAD-dependent oxidoreductase [Verrucomicrobiales bacterium]|nr:FAD-dependent oxidoreductase [Verrucomicrobiales bacterium]
MLKLFALLVIPWSLAAQESIFLEAEAFARHGGWTLDTQFIEIMGSPYLMAHGLGRPVADATTAVDIAAPGTYQVWVRTKDWVARWQAPGTPGKFQLIINGKPLEQTLGTQGADWHWQAAGRAELPAGRAMVALHDLSGFNGRCDAVVLSKTPGVDPEKFAAGERKRLRESIAAEHAREYDLVVVGGGYAGMGAAISAARQGIKVALIQNRSVLGGNGSSEIRVWAQGGTRRGLFPRLGEIVEEFADHAPNSPGLAEDFGDARKEQIIRAERNIDLFLNHHAIAASMQAGTARLIRSVTALDTLSGKTREFRGRLFADCTGHGTLGDLAGAEFTLQETGHLGMSNMWYWKEAAEPQPFPKTDWALPLEPGDFPLTKKADGTESYHKGEWFWESGFSRHPLRDLEWTRDWNLRAVFGAFNAMKNGPEAEKYARARLEWVASVGGTRESRLLQGDVVLTEKDIVEQKAFPDATVPTTWDIDLHYPKQQYAKKFPDDPFISKAVFGKGVDRKEGYPVPYRCFYSRNVDNLFMAGRCLSVTHEALGTVRVMRTCGMMGEVVGKAAYLCVSENASPRGVYQSHLEALKELLRLPGGARREKVGAAAVLPAVSPLSTPAAEGTNRAARLDPLKLGGLLVVDDSQAKFTGKWTHGTGLPGYVGSGYHYASGGSEASARFEFAVPKHGRYEIRIAWQPHQNRAQSVPCEIETGAETQTVRLNQKAAPTLENGFTSIGKFSLVSGKVCAVTIHCQGTEGHVHADAVWVGPAQ